MNAKNQNPFLKKLVSIIEANLSKETFGVSELAGELNMSRSNLHRKVRTLANVSVSQFIRDVRLEKAMEMLKAKEGNVSEVAYQVGFNSVTYFSKCFHDAFDKTPGEILNEEFIEEEITGEPFGEVKSQKSIIQKSTVYLLTAFSVIAVVVIIMLIQAGSDRHLNRLAIIPFEFENPELNEIDYVFRNDFHKKLRNENLDLISQLISGEKRYKSAGYLLTINELELDYLVAGKYYKKSDTTMLYIELIEGKTGNTAWSDDLIIGDSIIFSTTGKTALSILVAIGLRLEEEVEENLQKLPSENRQALKLYQEGLIAKANFLKTWKTEYLGASRISFEQAIELDSTFADAFVELGMLQMEIIAPGAPVPANWRKWARENAEKALKYDSENSAAWYIVGKYHFLNGNRNAADSCMILSEHFATDNVDFHYRQLLWHNQTGNDAKLIEHGLKYFELLPDSLQPSLYLLQWMWNSLAMTGFRDAAYHFSNVNYQITKDNYGHLGRKMTIENWLGNFEEAIKAAKLRIQEKPEDISNLNRLNFLYLAQGKPEQALTYARQYEKGKIEKEGRLNPHWYSDGAIAITYWTTGDTAKAMSIFNTIIQQQEKQIKENDPMAQGYVASPNLALFYSTIGNTEKAFKYLELCKNASANYSYIYSVLKLNIFDKYKNLPEFQEIYQTIEKNYHQEREKIKINLKKYNLSVS